MTADYVDQAHEIPVKASLGISLIRNTGSRGSASFSLGTSPEFNCRLIWPLLRGLAPGKALCIGNTRSARATACKGILDNLPYPAAEAAALIAAAIPD